MQALKSAVHVEAELLLTHHPLIFRPILSLDINAYPGNVIIEAVHKRIAIVAAHTNLDVARGGINDMLADLLGLKNVDVLREIHGMTDAGLGRIGDLPRPVEFDQIKEHVMRVLETNQLRIAGPEKQVIRRVAVVGGSGGSLVSMAYEKGADLLITGDVSHHHALEAQSLGLTLIDGGHFHTEKAAFKAFAKPFKSMIEESGRDIAVVVNEEEVDPLVHETGS
jgi:dinuclear metal center YbgI/SA1388 family protein